MEEEVDLNHKDSEQDLNYKAPPEKSLNEIIEADKNDPSLQLYKEKLLGSATKEMIILDEKNPSRVIVKQVALVVDGRDDMILDLRNEKLEDIKKKNFVVKEGISYRIRIDFYVQREIVTGLKYVQKIIRKGITCETITQMVGSYAPKLDLQSFLGPVEEMPSGLIFRDHYKVKSLFTDDDKNEHLKWEWSFDLKKDWD